MPDDYIDRNYDNVTLYTNINVYTSFSGKKKELNASCLCHLICEKKINRLPVLSFEKVALYKKNWGVGKRKRRKGEVDHSFYYLDI